MTEATAGTTSASRILAEGLWWQTPGLASLIGLCPLLAVSRRLATGLALGIASLAVITASNVLVSALGRRLPPRVRLPAFLLLIAGLVTAVDLLFQAHWYGLYAEVGLFVPLIVTNCLILARAESFAASNGVWRAFLDGLGYGLGFTLLLTGLGALREFLAPGLPVADLPAGALFLLAGLVALRQLWFRRLAAA
ncbi:MAG: electron transport complex subunit RsxE [Chromatiales bacterium]|nr:MAG: electron transport complex subunit RsxE [Chromatiales bacterium]